MVTAQGYIDPDYVDVAERIRLFYEKYPDGRLCTVEHDLYHVGEKTFVWCKAHAYRASDDPVPCAGTAWEPIPGPTPFTKDSELMNAETSAWGRAIIAAGIPSKKIASADEVRARTETTSTAKAVTKAQHGKIGALIKELSRQRPEDDWVGYSRGWINEQFGKTSRADLNTVEAGKLIDHLEGMLETVSAPFS